ncbi:MAG: hypothetical protein ABJC66_16370, partial [Gammaproteobacteria bacterium]
CCSFLAFAVATLLASSAAAALQCGADALFTGDRRAYGSFFGQRIETLRILRLRDTFKNLLLTVDGISS